MGIEVMAMLAVAGAATGAAGALQQGQAQKQGYEAKAAAANYNANVARQQGAQEQVAASAEADDYTRKGSFMSAAGRAGIGATGVTPAGSPLMVDSATVRELALGAARKNYAGAVRANRLNAQAGLDDFSARSARAAGETAVAGSYLKAGSSLLSAASKYKAFGGSDSGSNSNYGSGDYYE